MDKIKRLKGGLSLNGYMSTKTNLSERLILLTTDKQNIDYMLDRQTGKIIYERATAQFLNTVSHKNAWFSHKCKQGKPIRQLGYTLKVCVSKLSVTACYPC